MSATYGPAAPRRGNGYVALGDSISCAGTAGTAGGGFGQAWGHMVGVLSQQRLLYLGNGGVSGNNSTQILARVPDVIALNPQIVTVLAGTNDISQSVPFATWSTNMRAISGQLRAAGIRVVLCTIPPRDSASATTLTWNRWLRAYAQQNSYDLIDFHALLVDPATGTWKAGLALDSVHPAGGAHVTMAQHVVDQLLDTVPPFTPIRAGTATDADNLVVNPLLTTGAGPPTSWTVSGTAGITGFTETLQTDSDFAGRAWDWDVSNPSSTGFRQLLSTPINSGFAVGDTLLFTCKVKVMTSTNVTPGLDVGVRMYPYFIGASPSVVALNRGHSVVTAAGRYWFTYVVPAATTQIYMTMMCGTLPLTAVFKARVGEFGIYNLTALGLLPA